MMTLYPSISSALSRTASATASMSPWSRFGCPASHSSRCRSARRLLYGRLLCLRRWSRSDDALCSGTAAQQQVSQQGEGAEHPLCDLQHHIASKRQDAQHHTVQSATLRCVTAL
eukprot:GHRQ01019444.1.p1 GENE.GHRQ01019444.1~~GHRQ01019444.1.p1  ORF type:complete len:114 (-),score=24.38 GHRQ01019444.1:819-1160(-)